jgi:hypothetical protein
LVNLCDKNKLDGNDDVVMVGVKKMKSSWLFHDETISSCIDADLAPVHCSIVLTEKHHGSVDVTMVGMAKKCHREETRVIFLLVHMVALRLERVTK